MTQISGMTPKTALPASGALVPVAVSGDQTPYNFDLGAQLGQAVSVKTYGAKGNGVTDDTSAINTALGIAMASGAELFFPPGTYIISSALQVTAANLIIRGSGKGKTLITQSNAGQPIINVTANQTIIRDLGLGYSVTANASSTAAIIGNGQYCRYESIQVTSCYTGFLFEQSPFQDATDIEVFNYINAGLAFTAINDICVSQFILNANNSTNGAAGGINLQDRCEAIMLTDGEILNGVYSMKANASSNTVGNRPAYCRFSQCFFDSSTTGVVVNNSVELDFTGCWFSARPGAGVTLTNTDGIRFNGGEALNCGTHGVSVGSGAVKTVFRGFSARGNSQASSNSADGINVAAGVTDFVIQGCLLGGAIGFGSQRYGANVLTGASDRYIIADNLVSGNSTGGVSDNGTGTNKRVANNY